MNGNDNVFEISDYAEYFDSSATEIVDIPVEGSPSHPEAELPATDAQPPEAVEPQPSEPVDDLPSAEPDAETSGKASPEPPAVAEESGQPVISETIDYTKQFKDVNAHLKNIESISIVVLVSVGILIGINVLKILLDKLWR